MLCHTPTLTGVGLDVAKGTVTAALSSAPSNRGKAAKLRNLPVINAAGEACRADGNGKGNGLEPEAYQQKHLLNPGTQRDTEV